MQRGGRGKHVCRAASVADVWRKMVVGRSIVTSSSPPRDPFEAVVVFCALGDLDWIPVGVVVFVVVEKVTVDVPEVNELDVRRERPEIEGGDLDWADERWTGGVGELSVEDVNEMRGEGRVQFVPFQLDGHMDVLK